MPRAVRHDRDAGQRREERMPDDDELERELKSAEQLLDPIPLRLLRDAMDIFG